MRMLGALFVFVCPFREEACQCKDRCVAPNAVVVRAIVFYVFFHGFTFQKRKVSCFPPRIYPPPGFVFRQKEDIFPPAGNRGNCDMYMPGGYVLYISCDVSRVKYFEVLLSIQP